MSTSDAYRVFKCQEGKGRYGYVVRGRLNGRYVRKYFALKREAETYAAIKSTEIKNQGVEHAVFPTDLRLQAQKAELLLEPFGVNLLDAVLLAIPILEARGKSLPVETAIEKFLEDYRRHGGPKSAIPSVSYLKYLKDMLAPFRREYRERLVAELGSSEVDDFLAKRTRAGAVTRQSYLRAISAFFSWCVHKGFRLDNPLAKLRKKVPNGVVSILSPAEAEKLLKAALPDEVAFVALSLFCGIRVAEFQKRVRDSRGQESDVWLDWKDVDLDAGQVFISPQLEKNKHGRYVDIPPNAVSWLLPVKRTEGAVMPANWRVRRGELETRAQVELPQNVLRHSFCSYRIALDQDYSKAAAIVGNSPAMLRKHYVRVLPRKLGQEYFGICLCLSIVHPDNARGQRSQSGAPLRALYDDPK